MSDRTRHGGGGSGREGKLTRRGSRSARALPALGGVNVSNMLRRPRLISGPCLPADWIGRGTSGTRPNPQQSPGPGTLGQARAVSGNDSHCSSQIRGTNGGICFFFLVHRIHFHEHQMLNHSKQVRIVKIHLEIYRCYLGTCLIHTYADQ